VSAEESVELPVTPSDHALAHNTVASAAADALVAQKDELSGTVDAAMLTSIGLESELPSSLEVPEEMPGSSSKELPEDELTDTSVSEDMSQHKPDVLPKDVKEMLQDFSCKLSNSVDSDASTRTPNVDSATVEVEEKAQTLLICSSCTLDSPELFVDPTDGSRYCERCWLEFYGQSPTRFELPPLVEVEVSEVWHEDRLAQIWRDFPIPGWPPAPALPNADWTPAVDAEGEIWSNVAVRIRRDMVGPHSRERSNMDRPCPGEILAGKYRCGVAIGEGHFTRAFVAEDLTQGVSLCLKRHNSLGIDALSDLLVLGRRLHEVDRNAEYFPRLVDAFFDINGYTVESLLEGSNCLTIASAKPDFFAQQRNLQVVAHGALEGLKRLELAGVVHNDIKADNLMWVEVPVSASKGELASLEPQMRPMVRIVDFGCARLDYREEEPGRNWALAEGGAGHLGKWSPEMTLRLPISHKGDVWGLAVALCELHCGRNVWRNEQDTAEVVLAQALGLCNLYSGVPMSMIRRSPLDIRQLYTPAPRHFPVRRNMLDGSLEVIQPTFWGLEQVLGRNWQEAGKAGLHELLHAALVLDPMVRPSAAQLLESCTLVAEPEASDQPRGIFAQAANLARPPAAGTW